MSPDASTTTTAVEGLADDIVMADVASQQTYVRWSKGPFTATGVAIAKEATRTAIEIGGTVARTGLSTVAKVGVTFIVVLAGIGTGYLISQTNLLGSPQPTTVAVVTPTQQPPVVVTQPPVVVTQPPVVVTQPPVVVTQPPVVVTQPPVVVTQPPVVVTQPPATNTTISRLTALGLIEQVDIPPFSSSDARPGTPDPAEEPRDAPEYADLTGAWMASGDLSRQDLAVVGGLFGEVDLTAVLQEDYACTEPVVFCGPPKLEPGPYFFIGFQTAAPPPRKGTENQYQVYYLNTDLDGDWTNDRLVTPPRTDDIYLSTQYVIEAGWFGTTRGLGQTDFRGPVGPDGQTPRYNQQPRSRMVLTDDPPGGFFIIPQDDLGPWFRIASYWQDFSQEGVLAVDWVASSPRLALIPVPGRATLPATLSCGRIDLVAEPLDGQPSQLAGTLRFVDGEAPSTGSTLDFSLTSNADTVEVKGVMLTPTPDGGFAFRIGVATQATHAFASVVLTGDGQSVDLTDEFIVLMGAGVNVAEGAEGFVLGDPDCGSPP